MYENYGWKYLLTGIITILWGAALSQGIPLGLDLAGGDEIIYSLRWEGRAPNVTDTEDTVRVLRERIDSLGVKELSIRRQGMNEVVIQIPAATEGEVKRIQAQIEKTGRLQFKLVVSSLTGFEAQKEVARVLELKERGLWRDNDRYDVATWHEDAAEGLKGQPVLLENCTPSGKALYVDGSMLDNAYRTLDPDGNPCVGFEWNAQGKNLFYDLTSDNVGRSLAVVLDGEVRSAPNIKSAIGKRGIIEMGSRNDRKKAENDITNLIVTLKAGALPAEPVFAYRKHVGPQLGQTAVQVGGAATIATLIVIMGFMCWYYGVRQGMVANVAMVLNLFLVLGTLAMFDATLTLPGIAGLLLTAAMSVDGNILVNERIREEHERGAALRQAIQAGYSRAFWTIFDSHVTTLLAAIVLIWAGTGPIKGFGLTLAIGIVASMYTSLLVTQMIYGPAVVRGFITDINFRLLFHRTSFDFWSRFPKAITISMVVICVGWLVFLARGDDKYGIDFTGGTSLQMVLKQPIAKKDLEQRLHSHFEKTGQNVEVEVQQLGEEQGGADTGREWQLRTRLVGGAAPVAAPRGARAPGGLLDALITPAYGQDAAPVASPAAPAAAPPAAPATAAVEAPLVQDEKSRASQAFFEHEVKGLFREELVDPYPAVDGKAFVTVPAGAPGQVRARFRAELQGLPEGVGPGMDAKAVTVERLRAEMPKALRDLAGRIQGTSTEDMKRRSMLLGLAGAEGGEPGFIAAIATGVVAQVPLHSTPFELETHVVAEEQAADAVAVFKEGLEALQGEKIFVSPLVAIPNIDQIGSVVARNLQSKALVATIFSILFVCLYIWLRFDFWSGVTAIVALAHDVMALLGFMAILDLALDTMGINFDAKFNLTSITAFLTLIGFSINDTIVILDRIREDMHNAKAKEYTPELVNGAINKTLSRTVLTSLTVFLVVIILFVGSVNGLTAVQGFSIALLFGVITGTYSSIFVAAPLLIADRSKTYRFLIGVSAFLAITAFIKNVMA